MAVGTLLSRITGLLRDIALVAAIGTGIFSDAYSVANSIPNILYILIAGGALNAVFIPALVRHIADDEDGGKSFTDRLLSVTLLVLLSVVIVAIVAASSLATLYGTDSWSSATLDLATVFTRWCVPQILFYGLFTVISQVLNSRGVFGLPMYAPIINNLVVIITALSFTRLGTSPTPESVSAEQILLLGIGTTLGVILQALVLIPSLFKSGYRFTPTLSLRGSGLGKVGDLAIWTIGFVLVNQLSFVVISNLTTAANVTALELGQVAAGFTTYQKAQLMMMLPHSIITVSLVTALLPRMSKQAHDRDLAALGAEISSSLRLVVVLIIPSSVLLAISAGNLGEFLYGFGASSSEQGRAVGLVAAMFALALPSFSIFYVLLRVYYAQENTKTPFFINLIFNALHIGLGYLLFRIVPAKYQVASLAFAYAIGYLVVVLGTWRRIARRMPEIQTRQALRLFSQTLFAAAIAGLIAFVVLAFLPTGGALIQLFGLLICGLVFSAIFLAITYRMRISEVVHLMEIAKPRR
jgi:putative peptidoglycan lipid II flippase